MSRVYTLSPTFRAERSFSPKHLSEFTMLEVEEAYLESLDELMDRVESFCKFIAYYLSTHCKDDLNVILNETKYEFFDKILNCKYKRQVFT